jgi:hypothetical protein
VLPWWFVAGAIVTYAVLESLPGETGTLTSVFWVPIIVAVVRDRRILAEAAIERGESPGGRPGWLEPVVAIALTGLAIGSQVLLDTLLGRIDPARIVWSGGVVAAAALLLVAARFALRRDDGTAHAPPL